MPQLPRMPTGEVVSFSAALPILIFLIGLPPRKERCKAVCRGYDSNDALVAWGERDPRLYLSPRRPLRPGLEEHSP